MTPFEHFVVLLTPLAILTAMLSGIAFGVVVKWLRPAVDVHLVTYLALVLGCLIYAPQAAQLAFTWATTGEGVQPWATLGRWCLFTFAFVPPMWTVLRWRKS